MANPEQVRLLKESVAEWNRWRLEDSNTKARVILAIRDDFIKAGLREVDLRKADLRRTVLCDADLRGADLMQADLSEADLNGADLSWADLREADLYNADLSRARLQEANLTTAHLSNANLTDADLSRATLERAYLAEANLHYACLAFANLRNAVLDEANLSSANLYNADLSCAGLRGANLSEAKLSRAICRNADFTRATLVGTNVEEADLSGVRVYGISAWNLQLTGAVQRDLIIAPADEPIAITVDDLEIAQFIYLLLKNDHIRKVIQTITSKVVLILGRFTAERKAVLDALREALRRRDYLPVLFDFEKPSNQSNDETISTLAGMARFVIVDLTDAKSVLQELRNLVPNRPSLPIQPILLAGQAEPGMFDFFRLYPWVLKTRYYDTSGDLLMNLDDSVIDPPERLLTRE